MDRLTTKQNLHNLINHEGYGVIALTGDWGSGKTHLWKELATEKNITHTYFSLFGVKEAAQIKKGLALSRVNLDEQQGTQIQGGWKRVWPSISKTLDGLSESNGLVGAAASAVGDLIGDSVVDHLVANGVAVLDDIERADTKLSIEAIMGVIDSLRRAGCKVLIILSSSNLSSSSQSKWKEFYEKTIDIEISLQTDSSDAFEAVRGQAPTKWIPLIRKAWLASGCKNIRIAQRTIRTIETIFDNINLDVKLAETLISDTVWLTIGQFHGLVKGVDATQILSAVRKGTFLPGEQVDEETRKIRTALPVAFSYYQGFQDAVVEFLNTGSIDRKRWDQELQEMDKTYRAGNLLGRLTSWITDAHWDLQRADSDLRQEAEDLLKHGYLLKLQDAQGFMSGLNEIGADDLVEPFVQNWCAGVETHQLAYPMDLAYGPLDSIDPRMMEVTRKVHATISPPPSLKEALSKIMSSGGWSSADELTINDATDSDWRKFLQSDSKGEHLRLVRRLLESNYVKVASGISTASAVCHKIAFVEPDSKLGRLLRQREIVRNGAGKAT